MCSTNSHHAPTADNQTVNGLRIVIDLTLTHTDSSNTHHNQTSGLDSASGHGTAPPEKRGYLELEEGSGEPPRPSSNKRHRTAPELEAPQQQPHDVHVIITVRVADALPASATRPRIGSSRRSSSATLSDHGDGTGAVGG